MVLHPGVNQPTNGAKSVASCDVFKWITALHFAAEDRLHPYAHAWYFVDTDWLAGCRIGYWGLWVRQPETISEAVGRVSE